MHTAKAEIIINAPIDKVFAFLTNPANIPLVLPGLIENTDIPALPLKNGDRFNFKYKMYGVLVRGVTVIEKIEAPTLYYFSTTAGVTTQWREDFRQSGEGTLMSVSVEYEVPISLLDKVAGKITEALSRKELETYLQNVALVFSNKS